MGRDPVTTGQPYSRRKIYTTPRLQTFGPSQVHKLTGVLQQLDQDTTVHHLDDPSEFQLDHEGRTVKDGFQFTAAAFSQVAQQMGPGLSKFIPDITGTAVLPESRHTLVDATEAIRFWNHVVDLRFSLFQRYRVIRNVKTRTIEGLVGHKHHYLENLALYREACESIAVHHPNVRAYAASLVGRRLAIWFRSTSSLFTHQVDDEAWPFHYGYYFTNGEATGNAVRGTLAIYSRAGACLGDFKKYGARVCHTGKSFQQRLGQMFAKVIETEIPLDKLRVNSEKMMTQSLGFDPAWDKNQRNRHIRKLTHAVTVLGIPNTQAADVVNHALTSGRDRGQNAPTMRQLNILYSQRTLLDLYVPLLWTARETEISRREKIEQAAFDVLTGRFLI